jgi:site-specific DNA-methyltransferase (adenine-specific)
MPKKRFSADADDLVIDPFCGSGTTLVAAMLMNRRSVGIDISPEAVALTKSRLNDPVRTESALMQNGIEAYTKGHDRNDVRMNHRR